jgi:hypothetical protein
VTGYYAARVRTNTLAPSDDVTFRKATLVESYNAPDMLMLSGRQDELRQARVPGNGIMLTDDAGVRRFSGFLSSVQETGDGNCDLIFTGDLVVLWWRVCYPVPANDWTTAGQSSAHDTINASAEAKLLYYINRNAGAGSRTERKFSALTLPTSADRGPSGVTSARFDALGPLAAKLAESAGLRLRIEQTYDGPIGMTPHLSVTLTEAPDMSAAYRFGTARTAPYQVGSGWHTKIDIPLVTTALSAAGGEGNARSLNKATDSAAESLWGNRIEGFVDQRNTTDPTEITNGLADALASGAGPTEVSVPMPDSELVRNLPLGAKITARLGAAVFVDRIRERTTELGGDGASRKVSVVFGDPQSGVRTPLQRELARVRTRVQNLEKR